MGLFHIKTVWNSCPKLLYDQKHPEGRGKKQIRVAVWETPKSTEEALDAISVTGFLKRLFDCHVARISSCTKPLAAIKIQHTQSL